MEDTFVGPGLVECDQCHCAFAFQSGYGCSDPCHTQQSSHVYSYAFDEVSSVGVDPSNDIGGVPCSYRYADNIDASFPFQLVEIEEGCALLRVQAVNSPQLRSSVSIAYEILPFLLQTEYLQT